MLPKKLFKFLAISIVGMFLTATTALAYELTWDDQINTALTIGGFQLVNEAGDHATVYQSSTATGQFFNNGDTFTEEILLSVVNPLTESGNNIPPSYLGLDIFDINMSLAGFINLDPNTFAPTTFFTGGTGSMTDTGEDIMIMTFHLTSASPSVFSGSIYAPEGIHSNISLGFEIDTIDSNYFSTIALPNGIQDLVGAGFLLAIAEGNFAVETATWNDNGTEVIFETTTDGVRVLFDVVPEPTTMLLFGFGLLGLAGIGRKKVA